MDVRIGSIGHGKMDRTQIERGKSSPEFMGWRESTTNPLGRDSLTEAAIKYES